MRQRLKLGGGAGLGNGQGERRGSCVPPTRGNWTACGASSSACVGGNARRGAARRGRRVNEGQRLPRLAPPPQGHNLPGLAGFAAAACGRPCACLCARVSAPRPPGTSSCALLSPFVRFNPAQTRARTGKNKTREFKSKFLPQFTTIRYGNRAIEARHRGLTDP